MFTGKHEIQTYNRNFDTFWTLNQNFDSFFTQKLENFNLENQTAKCWRIWTHFVIKNQILTFFYPKNGQFWPEKPNIEISTKSEFKNQNRDKFLTLKLWHFLQVKNFKPKFWRFFLPKN